MLRIAAIAGRFFVQYRKCSAKVMVLASQYYLAARGQAKFHLQVEIESFNIHVTPEHFPVHAKVRRVFRGKKLIRVGDLIRFSVAVSSPQDLIPAGGILWMRRSSAETARFLEVFLDGDPPELDVRLSQVYCIESISETPQIEVPTEQEIADNGDATAPVSGLLSRILLWLLARSRRSKSRRLQK